MIFPRWGCGPGSPRGLDARWEPHAQDLAPGGSRHQEVRTPAPTATSALQVSGTWYSISMAADNRKRIEEDGDLRIFIEGIRVVEDGGLKLSFHFM